MRIPTALVLSLLSPVHRVAAYTAFPRWGQAHAVVGDCLYVYGGKTDELNSYSYNSAPSNNDLLYLSLSSPFDTSSPPWQLISSSTNISTSQGPIVAWHTLTPYTTRDLLLFGGDPGPNSPVVLPDRPDSASILDISDHTNPNWNIQRQSWAYQPSRRMMHTASSSQGKVWIIGGMKADGSGTALPDHYVFDPTGPSFTPLPSVNGPPDLYGHASIVVNGELLVFGGYSPSQATLLSFSVIWSLDTTQPSPSWTTVPVATGNIPSPRRAFASALLDGGKIIIHGGADATLQNAINDGWILDTTTIPMKWTVFEALSQLGARRDHFAIGIGASALFGFGYGSTGGLPTLVHIFDPPSNAFIPSFVPPPPSTTTNTLPDPTSTSTPDPGAKPPDTATDGEPNPTSTIDPSGSPSSHLRSKSNTVAVALGTTFGLLGLVTVAFLATYYIRHRNASRSRRFHPVGNWLGGSGDEEGRYRDIPTAHAYQEDKGLLSRRSNARGLLNSIGIGGLKTPARSATARRDMLADEDTRQFGLDDDDDDDGEGSGFYGRKEGSAGSVWSLMTAFGGRRSREPSMRGWGERPSSSTDPFADPLMRENDVTTSMHDVRPGHVTRQESYSSTVGTASYRDPFADYAVEETVFDAEGIGEPQPPRLVGGKPPPLRTTLPLATGRPALSPLTEQTTRSDFAGSSSDHSHHKQAVSGHEDSLDDTSYTSSGSPTPGTSSRVLVSGTTLPGSTPPESIRRSDSWWARISRSSFLDRRSSDAGRAPPKILDFRDPNPPPRLGAIQEVSVPQSPNSAPKKESYPLHDRIYSTAAHGRSVTSMRTADSEAIERMGAMDVVQRLGTSDSQMTSPSSGRTSPVDFGSTLSHPLPTPISTAFARDGHDEVVDSPTEMTETDLPMRRSEETLKPRTPPVSFGGAVAARVQEYERRMSYDVMESPGSSMSPNTREWEERGKKPLVTVNYGLAPKPSLFVANPSPTFSPSSSEN